MTTDSVATKNIELAFEIAFQWLADPSVGQEISELAEEGTFVLYDESDDELTSANDAMATRLQRRNQHVVKVALQRRTTLNRR